MQFSTYSPEDNKLRLYVGRVPRDEYEALREQGWTSTPKQNCDFVATWTPSRRDTALSYSDGIIEDEDMGPAERAVDRAERFAEYRDKRTAEAVGYADRYEAQPLAHGFQDGQKAERAAARHDRIASYAVDAWSKAEYWTSRTAGVISHALYSSRPDVRMGRIKVIEAEQRKHAANMESWVKTWKAWKKLSEMPDSEEKTRLVYQWTGNHSSGDYGFKHPRPETVTNSYIKEKGSDLYTLMGLVERGYGSNNITGTEACAMWFAKYPNEPQAEDDWSRHYALRLAYENQMLEAQGGRAASVEMIAGGWLGSRRVLKVNKSPATGRVVSVEVMGTTTGFTKESGYTIQETRPCPVLIKTERLPADAYRAPTTEELAEFNTAKKAKKDNAPKVQFINPTKADAERLQTLLNAKAAETDKGRNYPRQAGKVEELTQDRFSSGPTDYRATQTLHGVKLRFYSTGWRSVESVVVLTDKPQKPLPASFWEAYSKVPTSKPVTA